MSKRYIVIEYFCDDDRYIRGYDTLEEVKNGIEKIVADTLSFLGDYTGDYWKFEVYDSETVNDSGDGVFELITTVDFDDLDCEEAKNISCSITNNSVLEKLKS